MPPVRRFPLPWTIGETEACFYIEDAAGKRLAYCYFTVPRAGYSHDVSKLTRPEALRIVRNIAKLPELLQARPAIRQCTEYASDDDLASPH